MKKLCVLQQIKSLQNENEQFSAKAPQGFFGFFLTGFYLKAFRNEYEWDVQLERRMQPILGPRTQVEQCWVHSAVSYRPCTTAWVVMGIHYSSLLCVLQVWRRSVIASMVFVGATTEWLLLVVQYLYEMCPHKLKLNWNCLRWVLGYVQGCALSPVLSFFFFFPMNRIARCCYPGGWRLVQYGAQHPC